jgi:hypothetical protein
MGASDSVLSMELLLDTGVHSGIVSVEEQMRENEKVLLHKTAKYALFPAPLKSYLFHIGLPIGSPVLGYDTMRCTCTFELTKCTGCYLRCIHLGG